MKQRLHSVSIAIFRWWPCFLPYQGGIMFLDFQIYVCFSILKSLKNKNEEKKNTCNKLVVLQDHPSYTGRCIIY